MKFLKRLLNLYSFILCLSLVIYSLSKGKTAPDIILTILFLPILLFFFAQFSKKFFKKLNSPSLAVFQAVFLIYGFIFISVIIISNLFHIKQLSDAIFAAVFAPIEIYFLSYIIPGIKRVSLHFKEFKKQKSIPEKGINTSTPATVQEARRRQFLKLVGGTSIGLLVMYILSPKKAGAAFFGSIPGPGTITLKDTAGAKIDPAIKSPLDGYGITNIDNTAFPHYYGSVDKDGNWYILKEASDNTYRYSKGSSSFSTNWTGRTGLTYDYFNIVF